MFTYKIFNLENDGETISIWEYVNGKNTKNQCRAVSEYIDNLPQGEQKNNLNKKLMRLENVCKYLFVSDLHPDNIILKGVPESENPDIAAIDLESIQTNNETGLYLGNPPKTNLTIEEELCLNKVKLELRDTLQRLVIVRTGRLEGGLMRCDSYPHLFLNSREIGAFFDQFKTEIKTHLSQFKINKEPVPVHSPVIKC